MAQSAAPKSVVLLICDISGYTRFMLANHEAQMHGYVIISELMQALLRQTRLPLEVAKLEGDAVFLYAQTDTLSLKDSARQNDFRNRIYQLFWAFEEKLTELVASNICTCDGCVNAGRLRLKIVMHCGTAVFHRIGKFSELSGVDVILVHRLLKNSLKQDRYILLTDAARSLLWGQSEVSGEASEETYEEFGVVKTFALPPPPRPDMEAQSQKESRYANWRYKAKNILWRIFQSRLMSLRLKRKPRLTNLPMEE